MNKKVITAGAASLVLAAMPIVGTFALDGDKTTADDTITITIDPSCTLGAEATGKTVTKTMTESSHEDALAGSVFSVSCNDENGWTLTAVGAGSGGTKTDLATDGDTHQIPTGTTIDGSISNWAFKATGTHVADGKTEWTAIPDTATTIAEDTAADGEDSVTITYGVSIGADQESGTYNGKVTYVLAQKQAVGP